MEGSGRMSVSWPYESYSKDYTVEELTCCTSEIWVKKELSIEAVLGVTKVL